MANAHVEVNMNPIALTQMHEAIRRGVTDVVVYDMWPAAVEGSPVSKGKLQGGKYAGGGTNSRSISVEVNAFAEGTEVHGGDGAGKDGAPFDKNGGIAIPTPLGVSVAVYTQSGYGGYLETGTRFMAAQPYIFPAVENNMPKIAERVRYYTENVGSE